MSINSRFKRVIVVGSGSIGRRHARCLKTLSPNLEIILLRHKPRQNREELDKANGFDFVVYSAREALRFDCDAAIIANPSPYHVGIALEFAKAGLNLLVEKPISSNLEQAAQLVRYCSKNKVLLKIGYVLRLNPCLSAFRDMLIAGKIGSVLSFRTEVGHYLPDWRPDDDYRINVSSNRNLGGGALLELSHEFDCINWIFGKTISAQGIVKNTKTLDVDVEDMVLALVKVRCCDGREVLGSVNLDMVQRAPYRICRAVGLNATLECDLIQGVIKIFDSRNVTGREIFRSSVKDKDYIYKKQLIEFFASFGGMETILADGEDGLLALELAESIRLSSDLGERVLLGRNGS